jgi:16S rRNA (cytosine1402-N4)-methyltransferase
MEYYHIPVMLKEIVNYLQPQPGDYLVDGTLGGGGYTTALAKAVGPTGKVLAIDLDSLAIQNFKNNIDQEGLSNIILAQDNFRNLEEIVHNNWGEKQKINGLVLDLGLSSAQLADSERGFSFQQDAPLDMAFGDKSAKSTTEIINRYRAEELARIFREYGEERFPGRIAEAIVLARKQTPIKTTGQLVEIILKAIPKKFQHGAIHPATRVFQALRIETNEELDSLKEVLPAAVNLLKTGGKIAIVSFHSLEDRIVKQFFKNSEVLKVLHKKIITPTAEEINSNPRSRSAKLRVAEKI